MKTLSKISIAAAGLVLALSSATSSMAYPVVSTSSGAAGRAVARIQVTGSGWTNVILSGTVVVGGHIIRGKYVTLTVKQPNRTIINAGKTKTGQDGSFKIKIRNLSQLHGIYRITFGYLGKSTTVAIPVK